MECSNSQESSSISQLPDQNMDEQSLLPNSCAEIEEYPKVHTANEQSGNNAVEYSSVQMTEVMDDCGSDIEDSSSKQECNSDVSATGAVKIKNNKHRTIFDPKWLEKFPWLKHSIRNDSKGVLHCNLCIKYKKHCESPWVQNGCLKYPPRQNKSP